MGETRRRRLSRPMPKDATTQIAELLAMDMGLIAQLAEKRGMTLARLKSHIRDTADLARRTIAEPETRKRRYDAAFTLLLVDEIPPSPEPPAPE